MKKMTDLQVTVIGLGPMGRGIARLFARNGAQVTVVDATPELTATGTETIRSEAETDEEPVQLASTDDLSSAVTGADLVVEAIVERMEAKADLLTTVAGAARDDVMVASNTSSLSIGEMGRAFGRPQNFVGMHFFNPPTKMRLVEVIAGPQTATEVIEQVVHWVGELNRTPVVCQDSPNFIVNRSCRPLYYEAQLLLTQNVEAAVVDAVARGALGHRMGPLELLDFTGLHTHLASSETALREFGDPRYRPIPVTRQLVRNGLTGRAAGRGFYDYSHETPRQARGRVRRDPASTGDTTKVDVQGPGATALRPLLSEAEGPQDAVVLWSAPHTATDADVQAVRELVAAGRSVVVDSSDGRWVFDLPVGAGWLRLHTRTGQPFAEVVADPEAGIEPPPAVEAVLAAAGAASVSVPALPGLVADRLQHCLVNEAALLVEEGTATEDAVDTALKLGMNHPSGPLEYLDTAGADNVLASLTGMHAQLGDPRYRPTQLLRRRAAALTRKAATRKTAGESAGQR
jgi:3-hydroxybutyryl-CoA dehydrogenase